jgi:hypothetical protein
MDTATDRPNLTIADPPPAPPPAATAADPLKVRRWGALETSQLRFALRACSDHGLFLGMYLNRDPRPWREVQIGTVSDTAVLAADLWRLVSRVRRGLVDLLAAAPSALIDTQAVTGPLVLGVEDERGAREVCAEFGTPFPTTPGGMEALAQVGDLLIAELA